MISLYGLHCFCMFSKLNQLIVLRTWVCLVRITLCVGAATLHPAYLRKIHRTGPARSIHCTLYKCTFSVLLALNIRLNTCIPPTLQVSFLPYRFITLMQS